MKKSIKKYISLFCLISSLVMTFSSSSVAHITDKSNLYSNNELCLSSDDINKYKTLLSNVMGIDTDLITDADLLLYSIYSNYNLSEEEKVLLYQIDDLINDYDYIDKEDAYKNLLNLKINYKISTDKTTAGDYNYISDTINIYENDSNNSVKYHEIIHALFYNDNTKKLPNYFSEGMTELLNNEYFSEQPFIEEKNYPYQIITVKLLCELTSSDTVIKSFSTGNMNYIYEDLCGYGNYNLDDIKGYFSELSDLFKNIDSLDNNDLKKYNDITYFFDTVYSIKNGDNDNINYLYLRNLLDGITSNTKYSTYFSNLEEYGVSQKSYFNMRIGSEFEFIPFNFNCNVDNKILIK